MSTLRGFRCMGVFTDAIGRNSSFEVIAASPELAESFVEILTGKPAPGLVSVGFVDNPDWVHDEMDRELEHYYKGRRR